jgi:hypothetical protein
MVGLLGATAAGERAPQSTGEAAGGAPLAQALARTVDGAPVDASAAPQLLQLARERRALHAEGLVATAATAGLAAATTVELPWLAAAPVIGLYGAMTAGWVARFVALLARECPRCGGLFFYSLERLLYSLPYLGRQCAHCQQPLRPPP